ncbi:DUF2069 domain-containing protein [Seongchinamella unica]|uniref:DUF2069 domain-containing protein n=1 Tax=Seongchinamella unica TaxID=2547392 RepID=A0A4R5LTX0_9GAMM|nr:DUF2069 domain-containing protein [Seongchinamella unica]TDG14819.1 DUF2069 domain-containing protein [Seongchinamella unica]
MNSLAARTRVVCWLSYGVLLLQQVAEVWLGQAPWIIWLAVLLPLLVFLPGMLQDNLRSFIWLCFVCLLYFMRLVVSLFENPANVLAIIGMVAVVLLFCSGMMYVRWRARELRQAAAAAGGHGD